MHLNLSNDDKDEPKKKKTKNRQSNLIPKAGSVSKKQVLESMSSKFVGKRVLLKASALYHKNIPKGKENYLFQYHIAAINQDCKSLKKAAILS